MKNFISILLLFSTSFSVIIPFLPFIEYHVNYDVIVEHYCINRDNPEVDCDGACYLKDKIHDMHENHSSDAATPEQERSPILPMLAVSSVADAPNILADGRVCFRNSPLSYTSPFLVGLFRPPQG